VGAGLGLKSPCRFFTASKLSESNSSDSDSDDKRDRFFFPGRSNFDHVKCKSRVFLLAPSEHSIV
jgi:hypothetical protein